MGSLRGLGSGIESDECARYGRAILILSGIAILAKQHTESMIVTQSRTQFAQNNWLLRLFSACRRLDHEWQRLGCTARRC